MEFYEASSLEEEKKLQQGDVLFSVPFLVVSVTEAAILAPDAETPATVDLTRSADLGEESQVLARVSMSNGIVLNQSCDLSGQPGRDRPILVARILPPEAKRIKVSSSNVANNIEAIKALANPGRRPSLFYLPEYEGADFRMPRRVVDLLQIASFPPTNFAALSGLIRLRLSRDALQAFQERLAYCFGRFGAPDHLYLNEEEREHEEQ